MEREKMVEERRETGGWGQGGDGTEKEIGPELAQLEHRGRPVQVANKNKGLCVSMYVCWKRTRRFKIKY